MKLEPTLDCNDFRMVKYLAVQGKVDYLTLNMMVNICNESALSYIST